MSLPVRVRFAPSPTGYLHIGGARTALFNWLFARHHGGTFILRVEDTDTARNTQAAVDVIFQGLRWLGLEWDEGPQTSDPAGPSRGEFGSYFQSQRAGVYRRRLQELRDRHLAYDRDGAVYFRMTREPIAIPDLIVGDIVRPLTDREQADPDWVLWRSDGQPVFHFVNVVDDLEMKVSHVIRGEDHISNTAKHLALFRAFGVEPPRYGHIPLILNEDGSKMSKRDRGAVVTNYEDEGFLPAALVNYLALLGWSPADGQEQLSVPELIARFDLDRVNRSAARFDVKKLEALHFEHTRRLDPDAYVAQATPYLKRAGLALDSYPLAYVRAALLTTQEKGKRFRELPLWCDFYFTPDEAVTFEAEASTKALTPAAGPMLIQLSQAFDAVSEFTAAGLEAALKQRAAAAGVKVGALVQPCRVACTGRLVGPSLYHLLEVLGRERVRARLARAA
ncbi:MAG TPA: glutamate--tRNA ligase family protein, partial [Verrucomicrobiota bacterium]|nr:glutamate--tRNA ligase family protein [Verrucomicrobiota bacterium]